MTCRCACAVLLAFAVGACDRDASSAEDAAGDTAAALPADTSASAPPAGAAQDAWPATGAVDYRRERTVDFTGDGRDERLIATARGPSYPALDVAITIEGADGDTLWRESWPSLHYFKYDTLEGKADSMVMRIVSDHVDQLLATDRITLAGGLPAALRRGGDPDALMREAAHYHLAEIDYRRQADLTPADPTPPDGYSRISVETVGADRVSAVVGEVTSHPSYMYYAGGEATYVIAWSEREQAFVRIYSCC